MPALSFLFRLALPLVALLLAVSPERCPAAHRILVVCGNPGEPSYAESLGSTEKQWIEAAAKAGHSATSVPHSDSLPQIDALRNALAEVAASPSPDPLWLVLLGHGSAQGRSPKFMLHGPHLSADELAKMLAPVRRPVFVIAGFSCSGAFLKPLSDPNRILLTATKSGAEENWTRFPQFLTSALTSLDADTDADGQVSLREAWSHASRAVEDFYLQQGRLSTEHSVLDEGEAASPKAPPRRALRATDWFLLASPEEAGLSQDQRETRTTLEHALARLRESKSQTDPAEYSRKLEALLLQIARIYLPSTTPPPPPSAPVPEKK
ncbi:MAG: hypothetical protein RLZZ142_2888 [Verrucomicrobiota bacterium]